MEPKNSQLFVLDGGMNSDISAFELPPNQTRKQINCRGYSFGDRGVIKKIKGNTQIPYTQPEGINITLGAEPDEALNRIYFVNYNSNGFHTWYILDINLNKVSVLLRSRTDSNDVDIMRLNPNNLIFQIDIVDHDKIYWTDFGLNKARKFNINKALDKTDTGYGTIILEDYITSYKKAPVFAPAVHYFTDLTRTSNDLFNLQTKFMYRWIYDDAEISNYSDYSLVPKPANQSYLGISAINTDNNAVAVQVNTGSRLVVKIEIAVQIGSLKPVTCAVLHKDEFELTDNSTYSFVFYNDGAYMATDDEKIIRPYSFLPDKPKCQSKTKNALTYTNFKEGWPKVAVNMAINTTLTPIFLPDEETDSLNSPAITITETSHFSKSAGFLSGHYIVNTTHFIIGPDVKAGNRFIVAGSNGQSDNLFFAYLAGLSDNATTVANAIKTFLRSLNRGVPDAGNGISGEATDMSGNVSWDYEYLGHYNQNKTTFGGSVNPVNFATLKDNGFTQQLAKDGCVRQYAVMYIDDDGRWSDGYTSDDCSRRIPFVTETGVPLQFSTDNISIMHQPPLKARYWQLVRTADNTNFIQILIQKIINVDAVAGDGGSYLDLVVGSLFTYQKIHPNTILQYTFEKGDRLRLIKNEQDNSLYSYLETGVLSYSIDTEEVVNSQINVLGTDHVTPGAGVNADYIGKHIQIGGYEREIIGVSSGDYILDSPLSIGNVTTPTATLVPTYTFVDHRGIVRIKKPDVISVQDFALVEIYKPQKNSDDADFKIFQLCGQKYEISNYGTPQRAHMANLQNQDGTSTSTLITTPAVVQYSGGEAYLRYRAMPSNNQVVDAQVIIDHIVDPNFSDWYESNITDLGLQVPQDTGIGEVLFENRVRFSNNYIQDTQINGLADFDNLDREDYNEPHGATQRTEYHNDRLIMFMELKTTYSPIFKSIIIDESGNQLVGTSSKLLNGIQKYEWPGGVGNNPESVIIKDNYVYFTSVNSGVFIRLAGDGADPISTIYDYDKDARALLNIAGKYNLQIIPGVDAESGEVMWSFPAYIPYLFNKIFDPTDWNLINGNVPDGTTFSITTQPVHSAATIVSGLFNIVDTGVLGDDFLLYQAHYPDSTVGPIMKFCFTVVAKPPQPPAYRIRTSTDFCLQADGANTGKQGWTTLEGYNTSDGSLTGIITINLANNSKQAFVPDGASITWNFIDITPSGGSNNDIWYNEPSDALYKKIAGVWTLLTDRATNPYYVLPIDNTTDCAVPLPVDHFIVRAQYGMTVTGIVDVLTTGTPSLSPISVLPGQTLRVPYTAIDITGGGTSKITLTGTPANPFVEVHLVVGGVLKDSKPVTGPGDYVLTYPAGVTSPTDISWEIDLH